MTGRDWLYLFIGSLFAVLLGALATGIMLGVTMLIALLCTLLGVKFFTEQLDTMSDNCLDGQGYHSCEGCPGHFDSPPDEKPWYEEFKLGCGGENGCGGCTGCDLASEDFEPVD